MGAKFIGNPRFQKLATTATEGIYMYCKFDVDIAKGCRDIAPRILAEKRKWNQLWEFPEVIVRQNYVGVTLHHVYKFGTGRAIFDPL